MERPLTLRQKLALQKGEPTNKELGISILDKEVHYDISILEVTKIEHSPLAFGLFPLDALPNVKGQLLDVQIQVLGRLIGCRLSRDFVLEENPKMQGKELFKVHFNEGTILVYNEDGRVTHEKEKANKEDK